MVDFLLIGILLVIIASAVLYIVKEKKKGVKCIGCSMSGACHKQQKESPGHSCNGKKKGEGPGGCGHG